MSKRCYIPRGKIKKQKSLGGKKRGKIWPEIVLIGQYFKMLM